jgi:Type II secretory pathway, component PulJ
MRATRAFTLVEVLVAASLTLVLAGIMLGVIGSALEGWRRTQDSYTTRSQAAMVLDQIERDLQSAVFRADGKTWLAIDVDYALTGHGWQTSGTLKPSRLELLPERGGMLRIDEAKFGRTGAWLRLITADVRTTGAATLPIAVSYQVVRRSTSSGTPVNRETIRYLLFRSVEDGGAVLERGNDVTLHDAEFDGPSLPDVFATQVIDFGVWLYRRETSGTLTRIFPATTDDRSHVANGAASAPDVADVMVRILTDQGATMIAAIEQGRLAPPAGISMDEWWWRIAAEHSHTYVRRIAMQGGAR